MKNFSNMKNILSFAGGLAASQGLRITANSNISQARTLRNEAARKRAAGKVDEAKILESRANNLEQAAQRLLKEYERQQAKHKKRKS